MSEIPLYAIRLLTADFCSPRMLTSSHLLVEEDAFSGPKHAPLVQVTSAGSFACVPLFAADGSIYGTLTLDTFLDGRALQVLSGAVPRRARI